ncbi:hypothetical protein BGX26_004577 [Mortierella sp. AD094]|nr:hypothetical protein BGX26_004577 [Mortierella sp. AD094]
MFLSVATNEPWDTFIIERPTAIQRASTEREYYGPVCAILSESFRVRDRYMVVPQAYPLISRDDFVVEFTVERNGAPVFGMEIKSATDYNTIKRRIDVDRQVRERFVSLHASIRLSSLHIVSMVGTRCCVYTYNESQRQVTPAKIEPTDLRIVEDLAPAERWNIDIATLEGRLALNAVFDEVKRMVQEER